MFGKPLISSEIGTGTSFVNIHGETGLVVPPNDPVALRGALRTLHESSTLASEMGRRAYERFLAFFTADKMVDRYIDLYHQLLARGR
jgi:rhamnosyl/mannosyltransferase